MSPYKTHISVRITILLVVTFINVLIVKTAYLNNPNLYWILILSVPLLVYAMYKARNRNHEGLLKDADNHVKINGSNEKFDSDYYSCSSGNHNANELTVLFGNNDCAQPYLSSIICNKATCANQNSGLLREKLNSFGGINIARKQAENTPIADAFENDVIWQIGPGYPGCNKEDLKFNPELFRLNAANPLVRMIELKLLSPADKMDSLSKRDIYADTGIKKQYSGNNLHTVAAHTAFGNAESMILFLESLRQLSGKKPVGVRFGITSRRDLYEICYAIRKTEITPDYFVIEGNTQAGNSLFLPSGNSQMPLFEALLFTSGTLEKYGLKKEIKIIAAAEIHTAFDVLRLRALGADAIRMENHFIRNNKYRNLNRLETSDFFEESIRNLRQEIIRNTAKMMDACGYLHFEEITLATFLRNLDLLQSENNYTKPGRRFPDVSPGISFDVAKSSRYEKDYKSAVALF